MKEERLGTRPGGQSAREQKRKQLYKLQVRCSAIIILLHAITVS